MNKQQRAEEIKRKGRVTLGPEGAGEPQERKEGQKKGALRLTYDSDFEKPSVLLLQCDEDQKSEDQDDEVYIEQWCRDGYNLGDGRARERELSYRKVLMAPPADLDIELPMAREIDEDFWYLAGLNDSLTEKRGTSAEWRTPYTVMMSTPQNLRFEQPSQFK